MPGYYLVFLMVGFLASCTCTKGATRCHGNAAQVCTNTLEWQTVTDCEAAQDFNGNPVPMECREVESSDPKGPESVHACVPPSDDE